MKRTTPRRSFIQAAGNHLRSLHREIGVTRDDVVAAIQPGTYLDGYAQRHGYDLEKANSRLIDEILKWARSEWL
jgi:hypothetical protein